MSFLHPDGSFAHITQEHPEAGIDLPFLVGTIPYAKRLAAAFRAAGRPVVNVAHVLKPDYSDAAWPFWRLGMEPATGNRTHCVEGTWGAEVIDELKPYDGEPVVDLFIANRPLRLASLIIPGVLERKTESLLPSSPPLSD